MDAKLKSLKCCLLLAIGGIIAEALLLAVSSRFNAMGSRAGVLNYHMRESEGVNGQLQLFGGLSAEIMDPEGASNPQTESMVLCLSYWEQMGNALKSLFDLQCWSDIVGIKKTLEPSIHQTSAGVLYFSPGDAGLKFGDLYDLDHWNNMSLEYGFSELVSLEYFLNRAARDIVFVQMFDRCLKLTRFPGKSGTSF